MPSLTAWIVTTRVITRIEAHGPGEALEKAGVLITSQLPGSTIAHQRTVHITWAEQAVARAKAEAREEG